MSNRQLEHLNAVYESMCAAYRDNGMTVEELVYAMAANLGKVIATAQAEGCKYTPAQLRLLSIGAMDGAVATWGSNESEAA